MKAPNLPGIVALVLLSAGCSPTVMDIRPYAAHPDQALETEDLLVSTQNGMRTAVRYMRDAELNEAFRLPGQANRTSNPFLYKPPLAKTRFTVFRVNLRNESDNTAIVPFDKVRLIDDSGQVHRPLTRQELTNYWIGLVRIRLGQPVTWTEQMKALEFRVEKEKMLEQTIYEGGPLPPRGEHTGYIAFRGLPENTKSAQLLIEIVTRASRYGNPLAVALLEMNFSRVRVPVRPQYIEPEDSEEWR